MGNPFVLSAPTGYNPNAPGGRVGSVEHLYGEAVNLYAHLAALVTATQQAATFWASDARLSPVYQEELARLQLLLGQARTIMIELQGQIGQGAPAR